MLTKCSLRYAAVASSSNDSCAMTWHQWQAAYPTLSSTGTFRWRASPKASSPHSHQSTGLSACWSRYGLVADARRFGTLSTLARARQGPDGARVTRSVHFVTPPRDTPEPQDRGDSANRRTIDSYERIAREYAADTAPDSSGAAEFSREGLRRLVDAVPAGGAALDVGSGPGWDADFVESQGVVVRRTDVAAAFIDFQAERGKHVEKLDVTRDELGGPYDAVMALAVLQHVDRAQVPSLLRRVAAALRPGGVFLVAIPTGVGESWEVGESGNHYFTVLWGSPPSAPCSRTSGSGSSGASVTTTPRRTAG